MFLKRFLINGSVGSSYALARGIVKPEKEDKISFNRISKGFIEGIFLGEGARYIYGINPSFMNGLKPALTNFIKYVKICTGAALGSIVFKFAEYIIENSSRKTPEQNNKFVDDQCKPKSFVEHLFKGNTYPTIIS